MIDIHSHILWGLDDGAHSFGESVAMVRAAFEAGTRAMVATPHANGEYDPADEAIEERMAELRKAAPEGLEIYRGRDMHLTPANILEVMKSAKRLAINGGRHVLVEFADLFIPPTAGNVLRSMVDAGLTPVITHPERNRHLQRDFGRLARWVEAGCLVQVTALSLFGRFGRTAGKAAWEMLEEGIAHVIASDAHDAHHRHPRMDKAYAAVEEQFGAARAREVFVDTPQAIIVNGHAVD